MAWHAVACAIAGLGHDGDSRVVAPEEVFAKFGAKVSTRREGRYLRVESDGLPAHRMMVGITAWQQQVPLPQPYRGDNAWAIPLQPVPAQSPLSAKEHFFRGAIAVAANGIPIFNPIKNDGRTDTFLAGELDEFGGHCGRADDYHYHMAPTHLQAAVGADKPVAYALDGYPIHGFKDPDGSVPSNLDAFNGHEVPGMGYHYHATTNYPYLNGGFHGEVTERGGQVEPQAEARPVRPALPPLRGARIMGFTNHDDRAFALEVMVGKSAQFVRYVLRTNDVVDFEFVDGQGRVRRESHAIPSGGPRGRGGSGDRPGRRTGRGEAEPGGPRREASPDGAPRQPWIRVHAAEMDANADGALAREEMDAEVARTLKALDANSDGWVAAGERRGGPGGGTAMGGFVDQHWDEVDADGDGRVTRDELGALANRMFRRADADGDGNVSAVELKTMQGGAGRAGRKARP